MVPRIIIIQQTLFRISYFSSNPRDIEKFLLGTYIITIQHGTILKVFKESGKVSALIPFELILEG